MKNLALVSRRFTAISSLLFALSFHAHAAPPLRALLITGGCCHDYTNQTRILTNGITARANVAWTVLREDAETRDRAISIYTNDNWAKGFDVILHNECFGQVTNTAYVDRIARAHRDGVPAVVLHCSMHSYREAVTDEWRKTLGVSSYRHQHHVAFEVKNLMPSHPVMKNFPEMWKTPKGELYEIEKLWPGCVPLGQAFGERTQKDHVCIWVNTYGEGRVFGTTIGHYNEEMDNDVFLGLVTRGLLWACNRLDNNGEPELGYGPTLPVLK